MGWSIAISSFIIFIFSYSLFNKEIFSPTVLLSLSFWASGLLLGIYQYAWGSKFHFNTYIVIVGGLLISFVGEALVRNFYRGTRITDYDDVIEIREEYVYVSKLLILITDIAAVIVFVLYFREMIRMAYLGGYSGVGSIVYYSRNYMMFHYNELDSGERISPLLTQSFNMIRGIAHVYILIFINNVVVEGFFQTLKKQGGILILPIINLVAGVILNGGKMRLAQFVLTIVFMAFAAYCIRNGMTLSANLNVIKRLTIIVVSIVFALRIAQGLIGRMFRGSGIIEFVAFMFGSPLELFNRFLQNPVKTGRLVGEETFFGFLSLLDRLKIIDYSGSVQLEFSNIGSLRGNVYTGYRRLFSDFGYMGMFALHLLMIIVLSIMYCKVRELTYKHSYDYLWKILIYSYFYWVLIMYPFDNSFYSFISIKEVVTIMAMAISYKLLIEKPIVITFGKK